MTSKAFARKFEALKTRLSKDRDELRALIDDADCIMSNADDALDYMRCAADCLSEQL